ncbi:MAG TPA: rhomboid family intramembrane serine protease [Baekduia sp.]|nr:rhomboid family intramembrane serine protease [Baekduia sp.]
MAGAPDLFVVCKKCGSEESPYITECPYCGTRLRKRAPKIERDGGEAKPREPRRKVPRPKLRPRPGREIPGLQGDAFGRPTATIVLVLLSLFGYLALAFVEPFDVALRDLGGEPWRLATSAIAYDDTWVQLAVVLAIGIFGWRLELRHGPVLVVLLFLLGGVGGNAVAAAVEADPFVLGAGGAAMALLITWVLPDLLRERRGEDHDADLIGVAVIAVVLALLPVVNDEVSAVAIATGVVIGLVMGLALLRSEANR